MADDQARSCYSHHHHGMALGCTGESSVLALVNEHPGSEAIIDDLVGRKCAASLNIPVRGTLGIVLVAKKRGLIPKARPIIEAMMTAGLYLSRKVVDEALKRIGE